MSSFSPLKIGVMGCANIAWRSMIPAMAECDRIKLIAVASRSKTKAQKFAKKFNCEPIFGYEELLKRDDIEAIYMPLPTGLHYHWILETLKAGKHILVEKSFAMDYNSAQKMVDLAREKKLLIIENFLFPHHSQHQWVKNLLNRDAIGEIQLLRSTFGFPPLPKDNFRYKAGLGGGALLDAGAYVVKAATLFLGKELKLLGASLRYDTSSGVDILGYAMFTNPIGQVAQLSFGFNYYYQCNYELLGTQGKLIIERAFTPPPNFKPIARLESQDLKQEFTLPADNHFVNMLNFFSLTIKQQKDFSIHWDKLLNQAKLLDIIRQEGTP